MKPSNGKRIITQLKENVVAYNVKGDRVASEDTDRWIMDMQMTEWIYNFPLIIQPQVLSSTTHDLKENLYLLCR